MVADKNLCPNPEGSECRQFIWTNGYPANTRLLANDKLVDCWGDHSTPLGYYKAMRKNMAIRNLQVDAHCDLRRKLWKFNYSHASIMYNALEKSRRSRVVQIGIRDYCEEEWEYIKSSNSRVITYFDRQIKERQYEGRHGFGGEWNDQPSSANVYISLISTASILNYVHIRVHRYRAVWDRWDILPLQKLLERGADFLDLIWMKCGVSQENGTKRRCKGPVQVCNMLVASNH